MNKLITATRVSSIAFSVLAVLLIWVSAAMIMFGLNTTYSFENLLLLANTSTIFGGVFYVMSLIIELTLKEKETLSMINIEHEKEQTK